MNTLTLSRRIVAAIDPDCTRWPEWHSPATCTSCGAESAVVGEHLVCHACKQILGRIDAVPDLAQPCNLHLLLKVVRALGSAYELECCPREEFAPLRHSFKFKSPLWGERHYGETESAAVLAAVCAALGIEVEV